MNPYESKDVTKIIYTLDNYDVGDIVIIDSADEDLKSYYGVIEKLIDSNVLIQNKKYLYTIIDKIGHVEE